MLPYLNRIFIKICTLLEYTGDFVHKQLQKTVKANALERSAVFKWMKRFRGGVTSIEDQDRSGRPRTAITEEAMQQIEWLLEESHNWSLRELAARSGIPRKTVRRILKDELNLVKISAKWVPHVLSKEQKETRQYMTYNNILRFKADPDMLKKVIALDESWVFLYNPLCRDQAKF